MSLSGLDREAGTIPGMQNAEPTNCGTVVSRRRLLSTRRCHLVRIETPTHLLEVWTCVGAEEPKVGAVVYGLGPDPDYVAVEWPGGRSLFAIAREAPVLPRSFKTAARRLLGEALSVLAWALEVLRFARAVQLLGRTIEAVGCEQLGGLRVKSCSN